MVKKQNQHIVLTIDNILYFRAANYYVEAVLKSDEIEILDKSMNHLSQILPSNFFRIHRSYIVDINYIEFRKVEFYKGTQDGKVTAYVSKKEFKENDHNPLLRIITRFVPDKSVQPIDW